MVKYTITLKEVLDYGYNLFDFTYDVRGNIITKQELQDMFIDRYLISEINYPTITEFKHWLKQKWRNEMLVFNRKLEAYSNEIQILINNKGTQKGKTINQDMPRTKNVNTKDYANFVSDYETMFDSLSNVLPIDAVDKYISKYRNIVSEFIETFNTLFMEIL